MLGNVAHSYFWNDPWDQGLKNSSISMIRYSIEILGVTSFFPKIEKYCGCIQNITHILFHGYYLDKFQKREYMEKFRRDFLDISSIYSGYFTNISWIFCYFSIFHLELSSSRLSIIFPSQITK